MGFNLRVSVSVHQGDRPYMEDDYCVHCEREGSSGEPAFAYFGVFDGHGGPEAAKFTKAKLLANIRRSPGFRSGKDRLVLKAIREGFLLTQQQMWKELPKWPRTAGGHPSTSGTTATAAFLMNGKLYVGHVGDSAVVVGSQEGGLGKGPFRGVQLTQDHKPGAPEEKARIEKCGGHVITKSGVDRVAWLRPSAINKGTVRRSTRVDRVPFLAVSRALGDLWSYNYGTREYTVSPEPDLIALPLDTSKHRCIVLGSDGIWNMLSAQDAISCVEATERKWFAKATGRNDSGVQSTQETNGEHYNAAASLVARAHRLWQQRAARADNCTAIVVMLDPAGPSVCDELSALRLCRGLRMPSGSPSDEETPKESPVREYIQKMALDTSIGPHSVHDDLHCYQFRPTFRTFGTGLTSVTLFPLAVQTNRRLSCPTQSLSPGSQTVNKGPQPMVTIKTGLPSLASTDMLPGITGTSGLNKCIPDRPTQSLLRSGAACRLSPTGQLAHKRQLQPMCEMPDMRYAEHQTKRSRPAEEPHLRRAIISEAATAAPGSLESSEPTAGTASVERAVCAAKPVAECGQQLPPPVPWHFDPEHASSCGNSIAAPPPQTQPGLRCALEDELTNCMLVTAKAASHLAQHRHLHRTIDSADQSETDASAARCRGLPPDLLVLLRDSGRAVAETETSAAAASSQRRLLHPSVLAPNNDCSRTATSEASVNFCSPTLFTVSCDSKASTVPCRRPWQCSSINKERCCVQDFLSRKPLPPDPGTHAQPSFERVNGFAVSVGSEMEVADLAHSRVAVATRKRRATTPDSGERPPKLPATEAK